jgi:hypothetical protein
MRSRQTLSILHRQVLLLLSYLRRRTEDRSARRCAICPNSLRLSSTATRLPTSALQTSPHSYTRRALEIAANIQLARLLRPIAATYFQTLFWHGGRKQVSTSIRSCLVHVSCRFECTHIPSTNPLSPVLSARFWVPASSTPQAHSRFTLRLRSRTLYLSSACTYPSHSLSSLYGKDERAGLCSP